MGINIGCASRSRQPTGPITAHVGFLYTLCGCMNDKQYLMGDSFPYSLDPAGDFYNKNYALFYLLCDC